jgi:hypothetical protein
VPNLYKAFGGWSSIVSGSLLFIAHFINLFGESEEGTLFGSSLVFAAHVILIFALLGIYFELAQGTKILGLLGMVLSVIGTTIVSGIVLVEMGGFSGFNTDLVFKAPVVETVCIIGPLLFVIGMLMIGYYIIRFKKLPKTCGFLFIIGTIVFASASLIGSEKLVIEAIGGALTGLGFIGSGLNMIQVNSVNKSTELNL